VQGSSIPADTNEDYQPALLRDIKLGPSYDRTEVTAIIDSGCGVSLVTVSLARKLKLRWRAYRGPPRTWGSSAPMMCLGLVDLTLRLPIKKAGAQVVRDVVVVDDHSLPSQSPILLGTRALNSLGAVLDFRLRQFHVYGPSAALLPDAAPLEILREGLPIDFAGVSHPIRVSADTCLKPGETRSVQCYLMKPCYAKGTGSFTFVPRRFQPGPVSSWHSTEAGQEPCISNETHETHPFLGAAGAVAHIPDISASLRSWSRSPTLREVQAVAFDLELTNFGEQSIMLRADELVSATEQLDVDLADQIRRDRESKEKTWAQALLSTVPSESPPDPIMQSQQRLLEFVTDLVANYDAKTEAFIGPWSTAPAPADAPHPAADVWPPAHLRAAEVDDDGLKDVDRFVLPEDEPEQAVFDDMLALCLDIRDRSDMLPKEKVQGILVLLMNLPVFRYVLRDSKELGTNPEPLRIPSDQHPVYVRQWPMPPHKLEAVRTIARELLKQGVIEPSKSGWNAPVIIVPKKDGTWRFAVDYRRLNSVTEMDPAPVPNMKATLSRMGGNVWFSCCDLLSSFWQQPLCENDRPKTAFSIYGLGQFQWKVVPMGLKNSPQTQQRAMEQLLSGLNPSRVMCFIDDILVAGQTFEEHLAHLDVMMRRLQDVGLALKLRKCDFFRKEILYLGHVLGHGVIKREERITRKALEWPEPTDPSSLRGFLSCVGFYQDFIPKFAEIAAPLYKLTRKGVDFAATWAASPEYCDAWQQLRACIASDQVLALPDWDKEFFLATDASLVGMGAALCQQDEQGRLKPVVFLSRKWTSAERNYHSLEREAHAVVVAVSKLRYYLLGRKFTLLTDAMPLRQLFGLVPWDPQVRQSPRLGRWALSLANFEFEVIHVPGPKMVVADYLSRLNNDSVPDDQVEKNYANPWRCTSWDTRHLPDLATARREPVDSVTGCYLSPPEKWTPSVLSEWQQDDPILAILIRVASKQLGSEEGKAELLQVINSTQPTDRRRKVLRDNWGGINFPDFVLVDNVLYRRTEAGRQLVLPLPLRRLVLEYKHEGEHAGHPGVTRTVQRIASLYWWPRMRQDVEAYVQGCEDCKRVKPLRQRWKYGLTGALPLVFRPFERLSFDILTIESRAEFPYLLVVLDHATRYLITVPLATESHAEVAEALYTHVIERYGPPSVMLSDRGFESEVMTELFKTFGVRHVRTSPYHPQTNGANERINSTILTYLRALGAQAGQDWTHLLGAATYAYNTTYQTGIATIPYFLMFGRWPTDNVDLAITDLLELNATDNDLWRGPRPDVGTWNDRLAAARLLAQSHLYDVRAEAADKRDRNRQPTEGRFKVGDYVYYKPRLQAAR
jgi:transposase InsO family protein